MPPTAAYGDRKMKIGSGSPSVLADVHLLQVGTSELPVGPKSDARSDAPD